MQSVILFTLFLLQVNGELIDCGDRYDRSSWDCNDYKYHFAAERLDQTLYCLEFDKVVPVRRALNLPEPVPVKIRRQLLNFDVLDPGSNLITFKEILEIVVTDERLKFDAAECTFMEYEPNEALTSLIPIFFFLKSGIKMKELGFLTLTPEGTIKLVGLGMTTTSRCKIDLHKYPFDTHICSVDFTLSKILAYVPFESLHTFI